jgi:hypothetical protein
MSTKSRVGIILITLGNVVLAYSGVTLTTPGNPIEFPGLHMESAHSHFLPPVVGALALINGVFLLAVNPGRFEEAKHNERPNPNHP